MVDKLGPRTTCVVCWLLAALASLVFAAVPLLSLAMLFAWKIVGLLPEAVPPVVIARRYSENRTIVLSSFSTATRLISIAGPITIGFVSAFYPAAPFILRAAVLVLSSILIYVTNLE